MNDRPSATALRSMFFGLAIVGAGVVAGSSSGCRDGYAAGSRQAGAPRDAGQADTHSKADSTVNLADSLVARTFLEASNVSLSSGEKNCVALAKYHKSLGALARSYSKEANVENSVSCRRLPADENIWKCEATFIRNDSKQSERDMALTLRYEVSGGAIRALQCYVAG